VAEWEVVAGRLVVQLWNYLAGGGGPWKGFERLQFLAASF